MSFFDRFVKKLEVGASINDATQAKLNENGQVVPAGPGVKAQKSADELLKQLGKNGQEAGNDQVDSLLNLP